MNLRRNRPHIYGQTNRRSNEYLFRTNYNKSVSNLSATATSSSSIFSSSAEKSMAYLGNYRKTNQQPTLSGASAKIDTQSANKSSSVVSKLSMNAVNQIKGIFRGKKSIRKVIRGWNLMDKAYITAEQLKSTFNEKLKITLKDEQVSTIMQKFTNFKDQPDKLDAEGLVNLLFAHNENSLLNYKAAIQTEHSESRAIKIKQLLEGICPKPSSQKRRLSDFSNKQLEELVKDFNTCGSKMRQVFPSSTQLDKTTTKKLIRKSLKFTPDELNALDTVIQEVGYDETIQQVYNLQDSSRSIYDASFKKSSIFNKPFANQTLFKRQNSNQSILDRSSRLNDNLKLKTEFIASQLSPKSMGVINQQKTRFGATAKINILANPISQKLGDEKKKVDATLQKQRKQQKVRYQNKVEKLRNWQNQQQMRIVEIEEKENRRDQNNLRKRKNAVQAYNYVNYLKNDWI